MGFKDLIGQQFGKLTVIDRAPNKIDGSGRPRTMWNCKCSCDNKIVVVSTDYLKRSDCPSCGCEATKRRVDKNRINNIGEKFGRLTILDILWNEKRAKAICKCDCGNDYIGVKSDIVSGHTKSCGCFRQETTQINRLVHGMTDTRLYSIWKNMKKRCMNKNDEDYPLYGGRGIKVSKKWVNNFSNFMEWSLSHGYNDNLTLDRKDVNGNYKPSNCRWVTQQVNANNKSSNLYIRL